MARIVGLYGGLRTSMQVRRAGIQALCLRPQVIETQNSATVNVNINHG